MIIEKIKKEQQKKDVKVTVNVDETINVKIEKICKHHNIKKEIFIKEIIQSNKEIEKEYKSIIKKEQNSHI